MKKTSKGKPDKPPPEPIDPVPPTGEPVSGTFKGIANIDGGEQGKEVEGTFSGTCDPDTGECSMLIALFASEPPAVGAVSSVTKNNITINFASPAPAMQNFLGDWFIQGPVTVSSITPAPTGSGITKRNGAMVNPTNFVKQAFDGRISTNFPGFFDETTGYTVGTSIANGSSLICSISRNPADNLAALGANPRAIAEYEIFTIVATLPPTNAFRPAPCGTDKTLITTDDVNYALLPGLTPPVLQHGGSDPKSGSFSFDFTDPKQGLTRNWTDRSGGNSTDISGMAPDTYRNWYPTEHAAMVHRMAVYTMCNFSDVQTYANRLIQNGIDHKGVTTQSNWSWAGGQSSAASGGGNNGGAGYGAGGRLVSLLYAGWLLEDTSYRTIVTNGTAIAPLFGEQFSCYYSTTPFSGYATGYPASITGPNYPLYGDNNGGTPPFSSGHSTRDPAGKYNATGPAYDRYQCTDAGNTVMSNAGGYGYLFGTAVMGGIIWSRLAGQDAYWGNPAINSYFEWWANDPKVAISSGTDFSNPYFLDIYQFGGSGNYFMKKMWENYT